MMSLQPFAGGNVFNLMRRLERTSLFDTPAGFDEPLEMLLGCHRRIEKQLETLKRLRTRVEAHGVDAEASTAAQAILKYFVRAAPNHLEDEERDLFPMLERRISDDAEAARFRAFRESLEADHRVLEAAWTRLRKPLEGIADGLTRNLPAAEVSAFAEAYSRHIAAEEATLKELVERWLDDGDRQMLGRAMAARRGVQAPRAP
jgi:hemerythrin-like domain-containing protein